MSWERRPALRRPVMVVGFEGWNDAGEAASLCIDHMARLWDAEVVATIDSEEFYDFTVARPEVALDEDGTRYLVWPDPEILAATVPDAPRDVVLVRGFEPHMRWKAFCESLLHVARRMNVERVVLLGALLADVPHSRPTPVSGSSDDPALAELLGFEASSYEGPTGIVGTLHDAFAEAGLPMVSLWAAVPHYINQMPSPKGVLAILERLQIVLDTEIDLLELPDAVEEYDREVAEQISEDPDAAAYVAELEQAADIERSNAAESGRHGATVPSNEAHLPGAERLAAEVERYLREHRFGA